MSGIKGRPMHHDATQDTKTTVKIDVKEIPEELKQIRLGLGRC